MNHVLKRWLKAVIPPVLDATGVYERRIEAAARGRGLWLVLMYHRVGDVTTADPFGMGMCVTPGRFRDHIRFLQEEFEILPAGEMLQRLNQKGWQEGKYASITFDDGYLDNLEVAAPILDELGIRATVFVPTGGWENGDWFWWDRVIRAFRLTSLGRVPAVALDPHGVGASMALNGIRARAAAAAAVIEGLWRQHPDSIPDRVSEVEEALGVAPPAPWERNRLTIGDVAALAERGWEIGAHSITHPRLTALSPDRVRQELRGSRRTLEEALGIRVRGFAYPAGYVGPETEREVREAGYRYAVTTERGVNTGLSRPFRIMRMGAANEGVANVRRCVASLCVRGSGLEVAHDTV